MEPRRERANAPDENIRALYARLDDLCAQAGQGVAAVTPFLTPREAKYARQYLSGRLRAGLALLWGGYPDAERVRAFLLPDYLEGLLPTVGADGGGSLPTFCGQPGLTTLQRTRRSRPPRFRFVAPASGR